VARLRPEESEASAQTAARAHEWRRLERRRSPHPSQRRPPLLGSSLCSSLSSAHCLGEGRACGVRAQGHERGSERRRKSTGPVLCAATAPPPMALTRLCADTAAKAERETNAAQTARTPAGCAIARAAETRQQQDRRRARSQRKALPKSTGAAATAAAAGGRQQQAAAARRTSEKRSSRHTPARTEWCSAHRELASPGGAARAGGAAFDIGRGARGI